MKEPVVCGVRVVEMKVKPEVLEEDDEISEEVGLVDELVVDSSSPEPSAASKLNHSPSSIRSLKHQEKVSNYAIKRFGLEGLYYKLSSLPLF